MFWIGIGVGLVIALAGVVLFMFWQQSLSHRPHIGRFPAGGRVHLIIPLYRLVAIDTTKPYLDMLVEKRNNGKVENADTRD